MPVLAIGGVDLVVFVVALLAIICLLAAWVVFKIIEEVLGHIPIIGGYVGGVVTGWLASAMRTVISTFDTVTHAVAHFFWALGAGIWHWVYKVVQVIIDAKNTAVHAINLALAEGARAVAVAQQLYSQAIAWANHEAAVAITAAEGFAVTEVHDLENTVTADVAILSGDITRVFSQATTYADDLVNNLAAAVTADVKTLTTEVDKVESEAVRLFGQAEAAAEQLVNGVEAQVAALGGEIGQIGGQLAGVLTEVGPFLGLLPLIGALPALLTEVTTCMDPLCDTVTPNAKQLGDLGNLLSGLETIFDAALLGALVTAAVADPAGTAQAVVDVTGWIPELALTLTDAAGAAL